MLADLQPDQVLPQDIPIPRAIEAHQGHGLGAVPGEPPRAEELAVLHADEAFRYRVSRSSRSESDRGLRG